MSLSEQGEVLEIHAQYSASFPLRVIAVYVPSIPLSVLPAVLGASALSASQPFLLLCLHSHLHLVMLFL